MVFLRQHSHNYSKVKLTPLNANPFPNLENLLFNPFAGLKLRNVNIPNFDSNFGKWSSFEVAFISVVNKNRALSNVQKLSYLNSSLVGLAADVVDRLKITDDSYDIAWN